jgi:hypothetical protein
MLFAVNSPVSDDMMCNVHLQIQRCVNALSSVSGRALVVQAVVGLLTLVEMQESPSPAPHGVLEAIMLVGQGQLIRQRFIHVSVSGDIQSIDMEDG